MIRPEEYNLSTPDWIRRRKREELALARRRVAYWARIKLNSWYECTIDESVLWTNITVLADEEQELPKDLELRLPLCNKFFEFNSIESGPDDKRMSDPILVEIKERRGQSIPAIFDIQESLTIKRSLMPDKHIHRGRVYFYD